MIYYSLGFTDFYTNTSLIKICHIKMHIQIIHPRKQNIWPAVYNLWQKLLRDAQCAEYAWKKVE